MLRSSWAPMILIAGALGAHGPERVVSFIDHESARLASIKAYSPILASTKILAEISTFDHLHGIYPWYARVPTFPILATGRHDSFIPRRTCPEWTW